MKIVVPNTLQRYNNMVVSSTLTNDFAFPDWQSTDFFYQGNMCTYNGNLYRCLEFNDNKQPDLFDDYWYLFGAWDDSTEQVWDSGTDYSVGDLVSYHSGYKYYMYKATGASKGVKPTSVNTVWQNIGAVNIHRCVVGATQNKTEQRGDFSITINSNKADYFYMLGLNAHSAKIEIKNSDGDVLKSVSKELSYKNAASWKDYYFKDFTLKQTFGTELVLGYNNQVTFSVSSPSISRIGDVVIGRSFYIGEALWGASAGILDFSRKVRDSDFGDVSLSQGSYADKADVTVIVDTQRADAVKNFLTSVRGQEILTLGDERDTGFDMLKIRGFIRDFSVTLSNPVTTELTIQIEGLI